VYGVARRMMENHDEADDITQDVFITLYNSAHEFRGESTLFTWLYRVTTNACLNALRKKRVREYLRLDEIEGIFSSGDDEPDSLMEEEEQRSIIREAIASLPEKQKAVFVLRFYEEKSYEEISEILHTSVGGLKANYFHAMKKIGTFVRKSETGDGEGRT
jgi:RNA polymerase sigma-70 factor (ECF subfamily)